MLTLKSINKVKNSITKPKTDVKQKAIIIEFVGPPGAGKTSSCKCFAEQLKKKGFEVLMLQDVKDFLKNMNLSDKIFLSVKAIIFRSHSLLFYTATLAYNRIYSLNSINRYVRLTLYDLALKNLIKRQNINIVLLDQWIIQELWSATIFRAKSYNKISKSLSKFYFSTDAIFYFDIDINTASERIGMRRANLSRFDRMDAKKRMKELQNYNSYLFQLYESSDCKQKHLLSGLNSLENNAALFIEHFNMKFKVI